MKRNLWCAINNGRLVAIVGAAATTTMQKNGGASTCSTSCEAPPNDSKSPHPIRRAPQGWRRRFFVPKPPRELCRKDPVFELPRNALQRRQRDEHEQFQILAQIKSLLESNHNELAQRDKLQALQKQWLDVVYGATLQDRQAFLERYGCTGWTDKVLDELVSLGRSTGGIVELGAGNGQWARAVTDRYEEQTVPEHSGFEFVRAHDDFSALPLDPNVYHKHTQPCHDYFYDQVRQSTSIERTLTSWENRGRLLLLVYPGPNDLAVRALRAYDQVHGNNHHGTVVYVGEGRGGANATSDFFDHLEENHWYLYKVMDVRRFGNKGYEKLYILKKNPLHSD